MRTKRLYEMNPYEREFKARILDRRTAGDRCGIVLDQTLFYPASGGQPPDKGILAGLRVEDVFEEGEAIVHVLEGRVEGSDTVDGKIDWERRFDHMQQHTGQHILSQSFLQEASANTVSFHLGDEAATIDLDRDVTSPELIRGVETRANRTVFENRAVHLHEACGEAWKSFPLRRLPQVEGTVRIVEVADFDHAACCGTHVGHTGEIGLIKVIRAERYKGGTRVTFLCGLRALRDYQIKATHIRELSRSLSVGESEVLSAVERREEEMKEIGKRMRGLANSVLEGEARERVENAVSIDGHRLVSVCFDDREPWEVKTLVKKLIRLDSVVAVVGLVHGDGFFFFGRSESVELDMREVLDAVFSPGEYKGGGNASLVQGSCDDASRLREAVEKTSRIIEGMLRGRAR